MAGNLVGGGRQRRSIERRIRGRAFPSVFQAWSPADNLKGEDPETTIARHDLLFTGVQSLGLEWHGSHQGLATQFAPSTVNKGRAMRGRLLQKNPNLILIAEIRYRDAHRSYLPDGHGYWKYGAQGKPIIGWEEGGYFLLDFEKPEFQAQVAMQARAAVDSGVFDGVMLDWWVDDAARLSLIRKVREAIGEDALILANANDRQTPRTAPYINGFFMECYRTATAQNWQRIAATLLWAERNLRPPRINCLETWYEKSRADLNRMRATTTLALTLSDGYCLFSDPNPLPTPDHLHDWYPFWEKRLGRPVAPGKKQSDGSCTRAFERGTAVYNPMGGKPVTVTFPVAHTRVSTGQRSRKHNIPPLDGDIFLR